MLVPSKKMDEVIAIAREAAEATTVGDPNGNAMLGPVVNKTQFEARTVSQITALGGAGRIDELARMLGGIDITPTTRKHARELLAAVS